MPYFLAVATGAVLGEARARWEAQKKEIAQEVIREMGERPNKKEGVVRYSTEELIRELRCITNSANFFEAKKRFVVVNEAIKDSIIDRLRRADALAAAAKVIVTSLGSEYPKTMAVLNEAISDYEGKES